VQARGEEVGRGVVAVHDLVAVSLVPDAPGNASLPSFAVLPPVSYDAPDPPEYLAHYHTLPESVVANIWGTRCATTVILHDTRPDIAVVDSCIQFDSTPPPLRIRELQCELRDATRKAIASLGTLLVPNPRHGREFLLIETYPRELSQSDVSRNIGILRNWIGDKLITDDVVSAWTELPGGYRSYPALVGVDIGVAVTGGRSYEEDTGPLGQISDDRMVWTVIPLLRAAKISDLAYNRARTLASVPLALEGPESRGERKSRAAKNSRAANRISGIREISEIERDCLVEVFPVIGRNELPDLRRSEPFDTLKSRFLPDERVATLRLLVEYLVSRTRAMRQIEAIEGTAETQQLRLVGGLIALVVAGTAMFAGLATIPRTGLVTPYVRAGLLVVIVLLCGLFIGNLVWHAAQLTLEERSLRDLFSDLKPKSAAYMTSWVIAATALILACVGEAIAPYALVMWTCIGLLIMAVVIGAFAIERLTVSGDTDLPAV
jgi:hypothetical protein